MTTEIYEPSATSRVRSFLAIERQVLSFVKEIVASRNIDLIVCGERKGTAVMRALIQEIPDPRLQWSWKNVVSTISMDQFNWSEFKGERILLFEELVHHGRTLKRKKEGLAKLVGGKATIETAGFAVWDRCVDHPDFSYYASVDSDTYEAIRDEIVHMLQQYGSLLLDTEHIELSVKIECGINEFYRELARAADDGNTFSFLSSANRLNLTIQEPDIIEPNSLEKWLTPGSNIYGVVRKCRVIERDHNHFSIMPILYPNTRCVVDEQWIGSLPSFVDRDGLRHSRPKEVFYLVGLLASIELLRGIVLAMSNLLKDRKIVLEIPEESFTHLSAMFPRVDMGKLWEYVKDVVAMARLGKPRRSSKAVSVRNISESTLQNMACYLINNLLNETDRSETEGGEAKIKFPRGKSRIQLTQIARGAEGLIDVDPMAWGVVPDRLIDGGLMVTTVEEITSPQGDTWAIRTFLPDSEIVSERLRRHLAVRGLRWLPMT